MMMLQKTEFNKCEREMTKDEEENVRSLLLARSKKIFAFFDRACSWTLVERLGQKGEQTTNDGEKEREWGGKKAKREIQLAIFYTSIFAVITTCGKWDLCTSYLCEEGFFQVSASGKILEIYFRKWDYSYELMKVFFTPFAKIRLKLQNQEQVSSTAMWI